MIQLVMVIDIDGDVDRSGLERLRAHLNLKKQGRLTDDWDQEFGNRASEEANGQRTDIGLWREFDGTWKVSVFATSQPGPGSDKLVPLRTELVEGITAAGFHAIVRAKPSFGSRP